jgi:hypothetical protein
MAANPPPRPTAENILTLGGTLAAITAVYIAAHCIPLVIIATAAAIILVAMILIFHK